MLSSANSRRIPIRSSWSDAASSDDADSFSIPVITDLKAVLVVRAYSCAWSLTGETELGPLKRVIDKALTSIVSRCCNMERLHVSSRNRKGLLITCSSRVANSLNALLMASSRRTKASKYSCSDGVGHGSEEGDVGDGPRVELELVTSDRCVEGVGVVSLSSSRADPMIPISINTQKATPPHISSFFHILALRATCMGCPHLVQKGPETLVGSFRAIRVHPLSSMARPRSREVSQEPGLRWRMLRSPSPSGLAAVARAAAGEQRPGQRDNDDDGQTHDDGALGAHLQEQRTKRYHQRAHNDKGSQGQQEWKQDVHWCVSLVCQRVVYPLCVRVAAPPGGSPAYCTPFRQPVPYVL